MRQLFELVRQRFPDKSFRDLAAEAQRRGHDISHGTLASTAAGTSGARKATKKTLRAIADLAGVPDEVAFKAAGLPNLDLPPFAEQIERAGGDALNQKQRKAVLDVVREFRVLNEQLTGTASGKARAEAEKRATAGTERRSPIEDTGLHGREVLRDENDPLWQQSPFDAQENHK